jgi:hypothetical protein
MNAKPLFGTLIVSALSVAAASVVAAPKSCGRYDGLSAPRGPKIPEPYCTFDPNDSYGNI